MQSSDIFGISPQYKRPRGRPPKDYGEIPDDEREQLEIQMRNNPGTMCFNSRGERIYPRHKWKLQGTRVIFRTGDTPLGPG